jgi:glycosyltransferase involved in cell wall biosynthesis
MRTVFEETGIRLHASINPGGGLQPRTPREFLSVVEDHCATTFTNTRLVEGRLSRSVFVNVAVNTSLYQVTPKFSKPRIELVFCAHNDPWKGFELVAQAFNELDDDFFLHVIGNWEDKLDLLTNPKYQFHGLLEPQAIGRVLKEADVFLSGSTQYRDIHVDGFPTTAALEGMCTGCLLISPNALNEQQLVKRDLEYLEFDGANYRTLVAQLNWVRDHRAAAARIAQAGAQAVRTACDAEFVAATKLRHILGEP